MDSFSYEPYFTVLRRQQYFIELLSNCSGDNWIIINSRHGWYEIRHRHPWNKKYHHQTCLDNVRHCIMEIANHDEYMLRKRHIYVLPEYSLFLKLLEEERLTIPDTNNN